MWRSQLLFSRCKEKNRLCHFVAQAFFESKKNQFSVPLINQVHHHLHHHILFVRPAFGNHQRQGDQGIVGYALAAILAVEDAVVVEEPKEQRGRNTFVSVAERMVLGDESVVSFTPKR